MGVVLVQILFGSLLVVGWIMRAMQRSALKSWWKQSAPGRNGTSFEAWLRAQPATLEYAHWPQWFAAQNFFMTVKRQEAESWAHLWWRRLKAPLTSFWLNLKLGLQGLFNTWVLTLPGCALMLFSWYDGWNNSFNKGYEQAPVGPLTGILGIFLFIAAMLYVPMAQARQAVSGYWKSFYDVRTVWGLVRRHRGACFLLALGYSLLWFPINILKTAPYFLAHNNLAVENFTSDQALAFLTRYFFWCGFLVFPAILFLRLWAARIYARGLLSGLQKGSIPVQALAAREREELLRLDLIQITPPRSRHVLLQVAAQTGSGLWSTGLLVATGLVWFTFVAQIYIAEFIHYHPITGWINQPLVQLPWFRYVPAHLLNPWPEVFFTLALLVLLLGGASLAAKLKRLVRPAVPGSVPTPP